MVNLCLITPEITDRQGSFAYGYLSGRKSTYIPLFVVLSFRNAMEYWKADGHINNGDDQATPDINLVGLFCTSPGTSRVYVNQLCKLATGVDQHSG